MSVTIKLRKGLASEWTSNSSIVLASGEPGLEIDTGRLKIGNGTTQWGSLQYASIIPTGFLAGSGIDIDLGTNGSTATISVSGSFVADSGTFNQILFNTGLDDPDLLAGQLQWNSTEGTLGLGLNDNYTMNIGEEILYRVRNTTATTLLAGQPVYASGLSPGANNRIEINLYTADGSIREVRFMGLVTEDLPDNGSNGYTTHFGYIRGVDTRGDADTYGTTDKLWSTGEPVWNEGDILYVHPTVPGKLTKIEPKHSISVAIITSKSSNGKIFVRPTSYGHLDDNHDVSVSGATNGQFLQYNSSTDYWVPSSSGNFTTLLVNGTGVSVNGHTHTTSDITDFSGVSGLLPTIVNSGNNRILTSTGSSFGINAESNATFDGTTLAVSGALVIDKIKIDNNVIYAETPIDNKHYLGINVDQLIIDTTEYSAAAGSGGVTIFGINNPTLVITNEEDTNYAPEIKLRSKGSSLDELIIGSYSSSNANALGPGGVNRIYSPYTLDIITSNEIYLDSQLIRFGDNNLGYCYISNGNIGNELGLIADVDDAIAIKDMLDGSYRYGGPNGSEFLIISSSGNVGVGTDNPLYKLHVVGSGFVDGQLNIDNLRLDGNTLSSTNSNGNVIINPNGNGALQRDSGGNARGEYAVDWQTVRSTGTMVAAGSYSVIGGGSNNRSSGSNSTVGGGFSNTSSSYCSTVGGGYNNTSSGSYSTVGGGFGNTSSGNNSTVGGGIANTSSNYYSTVGGGIGNTSSSYYSTVGGGIRNTSSGGSSSTVGGGYSNTSSGYYSTIPGGRRAVASRYGELSHAAGRFAADGDAQHTVLIARRLTTNATANQVLFLDNSSSRLTLPAETTWAFTIKLSAYNDTDNEGGWWIFRGGIRRNAANGTALIGSLITESGFESSFNTASTSVVADDTNEALEIRVTGVASKNIRWVAVVDISQVSYGTP